MDATTRNLSSPPVPGELAEIGFFNEFGPEALEKIAPLVKTLPLRAGTVLFRRGEPFGNVIHVIRFGVVHQVWMDGKARERRAGEVLGLSSYLDSRPYSSTITTIEESEFLLLPAEQLRRLETTSSLVSDAMNRAIAERIRVAIMDVTPFLSLSVSQAMKTPLISCRPETTLHEAYLSMRSRRIGSLAIIDEADKPIGLLTCAELYEAVLEKGLSGEDKVISTGFQRPHEIAEGASLRQAEHLQERKGVKYLIVTGKEKPIGILSQTDILRAVARGASPLLAEARRAEDFATLRQLYRRLPRFTADIRNWNRSAMATIRALNEIHWVILQRCIGLTLAEIVDRGQGPPPAPFALVILGSGGRGEMLLTPDQDNAIVLADAVNRDTKAGGWFAGFTDNLNRHMAEVGYGLCPGGIMARNPSWRKRLSDWKRQFGRIIAHPNPRAARWSNITLDLKHLYGEESLVSELRREIAEKLKANHRLLRMMVEDDAEGRPPLGLFDRLITTTADGKKDRIDLKRNALRIVADAARVYAWRVGIDANNTEDRFRSLAQQGALSHEFVKTTLAAYDALLDLYMEQKLQQTLAGDADVEDRPDDDKLLDRNLLSPHEQELLRISLRTVKRLQKRMQEDFEVDL